jgi:hypothetical protein
MVLAAHKDASWKPSRIRWGRNIPSYESARPQENDRIQQQSNKQRKSEILGGKIAASRGKKSEKKKSEKEKQNKTKQNKTKKETKQTNKLSEYVNNEASEESIRTE